MAVIWMTKQFWPEMVDGKAGHIVDIFSFCGQGIEITNQQPGVEGEKHRR